MKLFTSRRKSEGRATGLASMMDQDGSENARPQQQQQATEKQQQSPSKSLLAGFGRSPNSNSRRRTKSISASTATKSTANLPNAGAVKRPESDGHDGATGESLLASTSSEALPISIPAAKETTRAYEVQYDFGTQLGLGLGIEAVPRQKHRQQGRRKDRVVVVAVFPTRISAVKGVQVGDYVMAINNSPIVGMSFDTVLTTIRTAPRPLKMTFERPDNFTATFSADAFHVCRDWSASPPRDLGDWQTYHVGYGMFRTPHQVQVYQCVTDYENALERAYRGKPLDTGDGMQPYTVTVDSELSELNEVSFGNQVITYFTLKPAVGLCKTLKIGSSTHAAVIGLHSAIRNSIAELNRRAGGCHLYSYY